MLIDSLASELASSVAQARTTLEGFSTFVRGLPSALAKKPTSENEEKSLVSKNISLSVGIVVASPSASPSLNMSLELTSTTKSTRMPHLWMLFGPLAITSAGLT